MSVARIARLSGRIVGWTVGVPLASLRFLTRRHAHEHEWRGDDPLAGLSPRAAKATGDDIREALGPVTHQLFRVTIENPRLSPEQLIDVIAANPNVVAPFEVLRFEKTAVRDERDLQEGDEVLIRMAGPWDGRVRIIERAAASFRAATDSSHVQSGQFELRARRDDGRIRFEVEAWDRPNRRSLALLHHRLGLTSRMQFHTWVHVCEQAARLAGGRVPDGVQVLTAREGGGRRRRSG